ncbi:hypothetical protein HY732_01765 [Candidatus Uhrbacteria bacterium]|nr:hypothetical protein [Candidatus Uhrbacteria bacterium]
MQPIEKSVRLASIEKKWRTPIRNLFYHWHWDDNLKHGEIGERVGLPRGTVTRWFRELHIPSQSCTRFTNLNLLNTGPRKGPRAKPKIKREFPRKVNQSFFETWSEEMAYTLGFFLADGAMTINPRGSKYIDFTSTDGDIIEKIRGALESNHKINALRPKGENRKIRYHLQLGSKKMFADLERFGITVRKSKKEKMPKVPEKYLMHFVRGFFDGDGHTCSFQYFKTGRKNISNGFQCGFTSGAKGILVALHKRLKGAGVVRGGSFEVRDSGAHLRYSVNDSLSFYHYIYDSMKSDLFLVRKKEKFEKFFVGR